MLRFIADFNRQFVERSSRQVSLYACHARLGNLYLVYPVSLYPPPPLISLYISLSFDLHRLFYIAS